MPSYTFEHRKSGKVIIEVMSFTVVDQWLVDHPQYFQVLGTPGFIPGINQKPDHVFRDILNNIKKANPGSQIDSY